MSPFRCTFGGLVGVLQSAIGSLGTGVEIGSWGSNGTDAGGRLHGSERARACIGRWVGDHCRGRAGGNVGGSLNQAATRQGEGGADRCVGRRPRVWRRVRSRRDVRMAGAAIRSPARAESDLRGSLAGCWMRAARPVAAPPEPSTSPRSGRSRPLGSASSTRVSISSPQTAHPCTP